MQELLLALSSIDITFYVTAFGLLVSTIFISIMVIVIFRAMKNKDLSRLVTDDSSGKLSLQKFWSNIAFVVTTVAFVKYNFESVTPSYIVELWAIYLTVFGGANVFSVWMKYRTKEKEMRYDMIERQNIPYYDKEYQDDIKDNNRYKRPPIE